MKILIVLAHPESKSMNGALFTTAIDTLTTAGHEVKASDLYRINFNPVSDQTNFSVLKNNDFFKQQREEEHATEHKYFAPDIEAEQQKVEWCDLMIWQFPLWWFSIPAILKGWVDRIFASGRFYGPGRLYDNGVCKEKKAMLSLTTGGGIPDYVKGGLNGDMHSMLMPLHRGIFRFTGFQVLQPHIVYSAARTGDEKRREALDQWSKRLKGIFDEEPLTIGTY